MGKRVKDMSPEEHEHVKKLARDAYHRNIESSRKKRRDFYNNRTHEQIEHAKQRDKSKRENMTDDGIEARNQYQREWYANLSPELLEKQRKRNRVANMTPKQREAKRVAALKYNQKPETIERAQKIRSEAISNFDTFIRYNHGFSHREYYIDIDLYSELWDEHVKKHGYNCAVTGEPFNLEIESKRPSPDQISPASGYWAWNIRFTTVAFNKARSNYGDESFDSMMRHYIAKNNIL